MLRQASFQHRDTESTELFAAWGPRCRNRGRWTLRRNVPTNDAETMRTVAARQRCPTNGTERTSQRLVPTYGEVAKARREPRSPKKRRDT